MGFSPTFRFGNPFFLQPNIDELIWRTQIKNNVSVVLGPHTMKFGGEWMHTLNDQIFRGFFTGRYLFDSVTGFLRYASPAAAGGFGPNTVGCSGGLSITAPAACPAGTQAAGGPLLLYLQGAGLSGPATDAAGASKISNDEFSLFVQDQWQPTTRLTLNYGLRWDAQTMPETFDPRSTAYGPSSKIALSLGWNDSRSVGHVSASVRRRMGPQGRRPVVRGSAGVYAARQNMLSQVGSVTTNGVQQQTLYVDTGLLRTFGAPTPTWPACSLPPAARRASFRSSAACVYSIVTTRTRACTLNAAYEQKITTDWAGYVDFTWAEGRKLTRFSTTTAATRSAAISTGDRQYACLYRRAVGAAARRSMVNNSLGESRYRGLTVGVRKRFSRGYPVRGELRNRQGRGQRLERT